MIEKVNREDDHILRDSRAMIHRTITSPPLKCSYLNHKDLFHPIQSTKAMDNELPPTPGVTILKSGDRQLHRSDEYKSIIPMAIHEYWITAAAAARWTRWLHHHPHHQSAVLTRRPSV